MGTPTVKPPASTPAGDLMRYTLAVIVAVRHNALTPVDGLRALDRLGWTPELARFVLQRWGQA